MNRVLFWGAGKNSKLIYDCIIKPLCTVTGIIDSNEEIQGSKWEENLIISSPAEIGRYEFDYLLITIWSEEISKELVDEIQDKGYRVIDFWHTNVFYDFIDYIGLYYNLMNAGKSNYTVSVMNVLRDRIQELCSQIGMLVGQRTDLISELETKNSRIDDLVGQIDMLVGQRTDLINELGILKKVVNEHIDRTNTAEYRIRQLELKVECLPEEISGRQTPNILPASDLLKRMIEEKVSVCRFGDGETELMRGNARPWFQGKDQELESRLREVFASTREDIVIAISDNFGRLDKYTETAAYHIRAYIKDKRDELTELYGLDRIYYDAYVSRPYLMYKDKSYSKEIFDLFKKLWENKRILLVEGVYMRSGIGNDLFNTASYVGRILCPAQDAYDYYDEILETINSKMSDFDIILLCLGPTATVLAYDVGVQGKQAIDLGQLDNEYEWYLSGVDRRTPIEGKAVPELNECHEAGDVEDELYLSQIITRIGC